MKRQIYTKLKELNNQSDLENSPKIKQNYNHKENLNNKNKYNPNEEHKIIENSKENNINSNSKRGKMGKLEYEIEPRNILLIPDTFNIKNTNLKVCEKELLPKEKNYFISETNFQLIKDALNEKENNNNELKLLLEKKDKEITLLEQENKKLEEANNELNLQIQKFDIYFNKMYQLLKYVFNYYNSFNDLEIKKFIKEQNLESLLNKENISGKNENTNNNNNTKNNKIGKGNGVISLFETNQDEIMKELEKYKKMYNDIRKQLNYITNIKSKENQNDYEKQILDSQKKINELNKENQNYIKENTYLKLLCKNMLLEKKIVEIDDNSQIIKGLEKSLEEEKNKNLNLIKENELLKKNVDSLLKEINQYKLDFNKINQENKSKTLELEKIKTEKERLEKIINDRNLKTNEELKFKNNIYSRKNNLEMNKQKSSWKKLKIDNTAKLFYNNNKSEDDIYNENKLNFIGLHDYSGQVDNADLLMLLYNKSKQLEPHLNNK